MEKLEIVLDEIAVADLNQLIGDFRHADATALIAFLDRRVRRRPASHPMAATDGASLEELGRRE